MVSVTEKSKNKRSKMRKNLFKDNRLFCGICKLWICGVFNIDSHFIVHSFKTWPTPSQSSNSNLTKVLKKRTEDLLEFENDLLDVSTALSKDLNNGQQRTLLPLLFDNNEFAEKFHTYFESDEDASNHSNEHLDNDNASTASTVLREDPLCKQELNENRIDQQEIAQDYVFGVEGQSLFKTNDIPAHFQDYGELELEQVEIKTEPEPEDTFCFENNINLNNCSNIVEKVRDTVIMNGLHQCNTDFFAERNSLMPTLHQSTFNLPFVFMEKYGKNSNTCVNYMAGIPIDNIQEIPLSEYDDESTTEMDCIRSSETENKKETYGVYNSKMETEKKPDCYMISYLDKETHFPTESCMGNRKEPDCLTNSNMESEEPNLATVFHMGKETQKEFVPKWQLGNELETEFAGKSHGNELGTEYFEKYPMGNELESEFFEESQGNELNTEYVEKSPMGNELETECVGKSPMGIELETEFVEETHGNELDTECVGKTPMGIELETVFVEETQGNELDTECVGKSPMGIELETECVGKSPMGIELETEFVEETQGNELDTECVGKSPMGNELETEFVEETPGNPLDTELVNETQGNELDTECVGKSPMGIELETELVNETQGNELDTELVKESPGNPLDTEYFGKSPMGNDNLIIITSKAQMEKQMETEVAPNSSMEIEKETDVVPNSSMEIEKGTDVVPNSSTEFEKGTDVVPNSSMEIDKAAPVKNSQPSSTVKKVSLTTSVKRDIKRIILLKNSEIPHVPIKKAKIQKGESLETPKETKNRKSHEIENKINNNKDNGAIGRCTVIQTHVKSKKMNNIANKKNLPPHSQKGDIKYSKEFSLQNNKKEATPNPNQLQTPIKLLLNKSPFGYKINNLMATPSSVNIDKMQERRKIRHINKLDEYIQAKGRSEAPLTADEIRHLRFIREEIRSMSISAKPSQELEDAMAATYELRTIEVRMNIMPIRDSVKIFYGLQSYPLLRKEFDRCTARSIKMLPYRLNKILEELIHKERLNTKLSDMYHVCNKAVQSLNNSQVDMKLQYNVGMILFGYKLTKGYWQGSLFHCRQKEDNIDLAKPTPTIVTVEGDLWTPYKKMDLYIERTKIGSTFNFYDAVVMAYVSYWVFNLEYDDALRPVFEYFDWIVGNPQNTYK